MMRDVDKTKEQLIDELVELREQVSHLSTSESERKRAEKALKQSEKTMRGLLNVIPDMMFRFTIDGMYTFYNKSDKFETLLSGDPSGKNMSEVMPEQIVEQRIQLAKQALEKGEIMKHVYPLTIDGKNHYRETRYVPYGENEVLAIVRDITEQKRLEQQLRHSQKMEAIGTLAGGVAHDFNNLIQGILGYTQLLLLDKSKDDQGYEELKQIEKTAERAAELTKQLLTFSRKIESRMISVNLTHHVKQVYELLKRTIPKMIEIELNLDDNLKTINADPSQMEQVLINLAVNAKDAMPEGGTMLIETGNVTPDDDFFKIHPGATPGDYVLLTLSDTGQGIDRDNLEHIFEPFYSTKEPGKGTGLGLSMVYGIVKNHGGSINCYSGAGVGTTFQIYLPAVEEGELSHETESRQAMLVGGSETILLSDDEDLIRNFGEQVLNRFGYTVITAPDGEKALQLYREKKDRIDLIILDLIMPGMGGRRCLDEILRINAGAKVIIASGYSADGYGKDAIKGGVAGFIEKPYQVKEMLQAVRAVLDNK